MCPVAMVPTMEAYRFVSASVCVRTSMTRSSQGDATMIAPGPRYLSIERSSRQASPVRRLTALVLVGLLMLPGMTHAAARQDDDGPRYTITDLGTIKDYPA